MELVSETLELIIDVLLFDRKGKVFIGTCQILMKCSKELSSDPCPLFDVAQLIHSWKCVFMTSQYLKGEMNCYL